MYQANILLLVLNVPQQLTAHGLGTTHLTPAHSDRTATGIKVRSQTTFCPTSN